MTRTYSSIREAMQCGIFDQQVAAAEGHIETQDPKASSHADATPSQRGASRTVAVRRSSRSSLVSTGSSSQPASQSFTAGTRRPSYRPDRRISSVINEEDSMDEDGSDILAITEICLSPSSSPPEEINVSELGEAELEMLRREDPFAYFSIPQHHTRQYRMFDDEEAQDQDAPQDRQEGMRMARRMSRSVPAGLLADADIARAALDDLGLLDDDDFDDFNSSSRSVVSRRSRISCEAHPSLVCYGLLDEVMADANEDDMEEGENRLLRMLVGDDQMEEKKE